MIVLVEGVDGAGKTTLIGHLLEHLAAQGRPGLLAPPLWTFLDPHFQPADFAPWVLATPGIDVACHLLRATTRRIHKLNTDLDLGILSADATVLVDRGPKTVTCSARAHAQTGGRPDHTRTTDLAAEEHALDEEVTSLANTARVVAIELRSDRAIDSVLARLTRTEEITPSYRAYLHALHQQMATETAWPEQPCLALDATATLTTNATRSLTWLAQQAQP